MNKLLCALLIFLLFLLPSCSESYEDYNWAMKNVGQKVCGDYFAPSGPPIRMDESFDIQLESIYPHIGSTKKATLSCKRGVYGYIKLMIICLF
jgi:hypothetical protein